MFIFPFATIKSKNKSILLFNRQDVNLPQEFSTVPWNLCHEASKTWKKTTQEDEQAIMPRGSHNPHNVFYQYQMLLEDVSEKIHLAQMIKVKVGENISFKSSMSFPASSYPTEPI